MDSSKNGRLGISALGILQISRDGQSLVEQLPIKGQALLLYLATNRQPYSRPALAGLLWGDMPEETARANLRLTLSRLRQNLGDVLIATRHAVSFDLDQPHWLDVAILTSAAARPEQSDLTQLNEALDLYQGDFLKDFFLAGSPEFETWVVTERQRLRQLAIGAASYLVEVFRQQGDFIAGIDRARWLLALEPWHEESHRQLMWLLAASGQRSAALAQFEECRRRLAEELGVEPGAETLALHQQIKSGAIGRGQDVLTPVPLDPRPVTMPPEHLATRLPDPPHNLPPQLTPFIGRKSELARLQEKLLAPGYRLVTIAGEGGVGKTRLALAVAGPIRPHFPDGSWFVSLAGLEALETNDQNGDAVENQIATAAGAALGITFATAQAPRTQLLNYLRHKNCLLILDNFEELLAGAPLVMDILTHAPAVAVLVTSREPLNFQAEYLIRLEGMPVPEEDSAAELAAFDSLALFAERAERASGRPFPAEASLPQVAQICRFVGGLPLAIELAASWTRRLTPAEILAALVESDDVLTTTMPDVPARHRTLQTVFENSWRLLSADEQTTLARLSVFRGRFSAEAATAVTQTAPAVLSSLVDKSLIQRSADGYLALHNLLCRFAAAKLAAMALDAHAIKCRHATYYLAFMAEQAQPLNGRQPHVALRRVQAEVDNVRQAWNWATADLDCVILAESLEGMASYWGYVGLYREGERALAQAAAGVQALLDSGEDAQTQERQRLLARLHAERAYLLYELTRHDETEQAARTALALAQAAGAADIEATAYLRLGQALWGRAQYGQARDQFEQALALLQKLNLPSLEATILRNLAAAVWRQGDLAQARDHCQAALAHHRQIGDARGEAKTNYMLGIITQNESNYREAGQICEDVLEVARATGDRRMELAAHSMLGLIASYRGELDKALAHFEQDLRLGREMGSLWSQAVTTSNLGDLKLRLGDYAGAETCYRQALDLHRQHGASPALESNVLAYLGLLAHFQGDHQVGIRHCRRALELAQELDIPREQGFAHIFLAHNLAGTGMLTEAESAYRAARSTWESLGDHSRAMEAVAGLARVALGRDNLDEALAHVETILAHLENSNLEGADDPVRVYLACYDVLQAAADPRAPAILDAAGHLLQERAAKIGDPNLRLSFLENIPSHRQLRRLARPL